MDRSVAARLVHIEGTLAVAVVEYVRGGVEEQRFVERWERSLWEWRSARFVVTDCCRGYIGNVWAMR